MRPVFPPTLKAREAFTRVVKYLQQHGIQDTHQAAQNFLTSLFKISYREYPNYSNHLLTPEQILKLGEYCHRRVQHEPIQYIVGDWDFYGRTFQCRRPILIPRPETENLIERILNSKILEKIPSPKILDVGCGSGVIGLTLAAEIPSAHCTALDIDSQAIELASMNCSQILCQSCLTPPTSSSSSTSVSRCCRYELHHTDLVSFFQQRSSSPAPDPSFSHFSHSSPSPRFGSFDLIVSNPPYIPSTELYSTSSPLQSEVFHYESHVALDGGPGHGLDLIRDILLHSSHSLRPEGTNELWMEVHETHPRLIRESYNRSRRSISESEDAEDVLEGCWDLYDLTDSYEDLFSQPRFVRFKKRNSATDSHMVRLK
jgi:release factor glutamine methyltransferase